MARPTHTASASTTPALLNIASSVTNAHLGVYDVQANTCNSKHLTETYAFQSRYTHVGPKGIIGIQKDAFEK